MRYFTDEFIKEKAAALGDPHRKLYKFIEDYYTRWNHAPQIETMALEMDGATKEQVYVFLFDLTAAGCLASWNSLADIRPVISPEDAMIWCGDDSVNVSERKCRIEMAISVFCFRNGGKMPELSGFMKTYEDSSLYWIIREQAEPFFSAIVRINDGNGTDTEGKAARLCMGD